MSHACPGSFPTLAFIDNPYAEVHTVPTAEETAMIASYLVAPLQESLVSHAFGRFIPRTEPSCDCVGAPLADSVSVLPSSAVLEDDVPDLAQRVRELGEW